MQATFIRNLERNFQGDERLYRVDSPVEYVDQYDYEIDRPYKNRVTHYLVVCADEDMFSDPEVRIYPSDEQGNILCWYSRGGPCRGGINHDEALTRAGYAVQP